MKTLLLLLLFIPTFSNAQSWQLFEDLDGFITDIEIINGQRYTTFKTGELLLGDSIIKTFPVQNYQETGLLAVCLWRDSICVSACGIDSIQRIICGSDTVLEVSYKSPWAIRHRAGDMVATDSVLYASFGYGADPDDSQDSTNFRGKIVAITPDTAYVVAYGLRNGWKMDIKGDTLYIADVGAQTEEEINRLSLDIVNLQEPVNLGWPCTEGNFVHDTTCGPTMAPFFTYPRANTANAIIGGKLFRNAFWWCDNYYKFGGYVYDDTSAVKTPCPQYPNGMYILGDSIYAYDYTGKIYLWVEGPLSIDTTEEEVYTEHKTTLTINQHEVRWADNLYGTLRILTLDGKVIRNKDAFEEGYISFDGFLPGLYVLMLENRHGVQWSKMFLINQ